jgi:hypothetical protein
MSSKKGMSREKFPLDRRPRRFLSRDPAHYPVSVPLDSLERFVLACLPFPWLSSSGVTIFSPEELIMRLVKIVF